VRLLSAPPEKGVSDVVSNSRLIKNPFVPENSVRGDASPSEILNTFILYLIPSFSSVLSILLATVLACSVFAQFRNAEFHAEREP